MISETPSLQRQVQPEVRFVSLIKSEFVKHAKEINRLNGIVDNIGGNSGGGSGSGLTYRLTKSGSNINLVGSDNSITSVTDESGTVDSSITTSMINSLF